MLVVGEGRSPSITSRPPHDLRVVLCRVPAADAGVVDTAGSTDVLAIDRPFLDNDGGWIGFGSKDDLLDSPSIATS